VDDDEGIDVVIVLEVGLSAIIGGIFDGLLSSCEGIVEESAAGLSSDVGHAADARGADGCSNILNQGCWRHSVAVRRSLRTDRNRLLEDERIECTRHISKHFRSIRAGVVAVADELFRCIALSDKYQPDNRLVPRTTRTTSRSLVNSRSAGSQRVKRPVA